MNFQSGMYLVIFLALVSCNSGRSTNMGGRYGPMGIPPGSYPVGASGDQKVLDKISMNQVEFSSDGFSENEHLDKKSSAEILAELGELEQDMKSFGIELLNSPKSNKTLGEMDINELKACRENLDLYLKLSHQISQKIQSQDTVFEMDQEFQTSLFKKKLSSAKKLAQIISTKLKKFNADETETEIIE